MSLKDESKRDEHIELGYLQTKIHHLPPTGENPSSNQGARDNLRHIGVCMGVRGFVSEEKVQRNNVILYEDGGGYSPTSKAINETFIDPICKMTFNSKTEFLDHWTESHDAFGIDNLHPYRLFKDFLVISGAGHHELNARKSFLSSEVTYNNFVGQAIMATGFTAIQSKYQSMTSDNHRLVYSV